VKVNEIQTRSTPTAAMLLILGHKITRTIYRDHGGSLLCFDASARPDFDKFVSTKKYVDGPLAEADGLR